MKISRIEKSILDQLDFLTNSLISLNYINNQLKALFDSGDLRLAKLNGSAPEFFIAVQNEFYISLVIRVCRILDDDKVAGSKTATICSLLKETRAHNGEFRGSSDPDELLPDISSLKFHNDRDTNRINELTMLLRKNINHQNIATLSKLQKDADREHMPTRRLRNNIIAHSNRDISINKEPILSTMREIDLSIICINKFIIEYHRIILNQHVDLLDDEGGRVINKLFANLK